MNKLTNIFLILLILIISGINTNKGIADNSKISPYLQMMLNNSSDNELIPIYILFKEHLTLNDFDDINYDTPKKERRQIVISRLQNFSANYQNGMRAYLTSKSVSDVREMEILWIINAISLKANSNIIHQMANEFDEIETIYYDAQYPIELLLDFPNTPIPYWNLLSPEPGCLLMNADDCWNLGNKGRGVVVANADNGFHWRHPDLVRGTWQNLGEDANSNGMTIIWASGTGSYFDPGDINGIDNDGNGKIDDLIGWDFTTNSYNITADSHGSATMGHVCGDGTGGTQTGVAPESKCLVMRNNGGETYQWAAFQYAILMGADVITSSLSYKWYFSPKPNYSAMRLVTDMSLAAGVIHANSTSNDGNNQGNAPIPMNISTAGNCPPPWLHPDQLKIGNLSSVIGCGNVNVYSDVIESSSPYGPTTWGNWSLWGTYTHSIDPNHRDYPYSRTPPVEIPDSMGLLKPDVSAPGQSSISTYVSSGSGYGTFGGTSSATPHTAGCLALMLSQNPEMLPRDVDRVLELTSIEKGAAGKDPRYGAGRIDALLATTSPPSLVEGIFGGSNWFIGETTPPNDTARELVGFKLKNTASPWIGSLKKLIYNVQGTATSSDVEKYRLFWDKNRNNVVDAGDVLLKEAPFMGTFEDFNQVTFDSLKFKVTDSLRHIIFTIKTKPTAVSSRIVQVGMPNNSHVTSYYSTLAQTTNFPFGNVTGINNQNENPLIFRLSQNYPNPFNPTTMITYSLQKSSFVSVKVYDALGREIAVLINNVRDQGIHRIEFDANFYKGLSSGIYFYKMEARDPNLRSSIFFTDVKKMILVK